MAVAERMEATKGAILSLLTDAYQRRDRVGLIVFQKDRATLVLPPTNSVLLAQRAMADVPVGGKTPLSAGLALALQVVTREKTLHPDILPLLIILTDLQTAIMYSVTVLVIACPHALGLAIPLVVARSTSLGASRGLLVKNREALELATRADVMVLDKTGTLTTGDFKVLKIETVGCLLYTSGHWHCVPAAGMPFHEPSPILWQKIHPNCQMPFSPGLKSRYSPTVDQHQPRG